MSLTAEAIAPISSVHMSAFATLPRPAALPAEVDERFAVEEDECVQGTVSVYRAALVSAVCAEAVCGDALVSVVSEEALGEVERTEAIAGLDAREATLEHREHRLLRMQGQQKNSHKALRRRHSTLVERERELAQMQDALAEEKRLHRARLAAFDEQQRAFAVAAGGPTLEINTLETNTSVEASGEQASGGDAGDEQLEFWEFDVAAQSSAESSSLEPISEHGEPRESQAGAIEESPRTGIAEGPQPRAADVLLHLQSPPLSQAIRAAMVAADWNPGRAAAALGLSRSALYDLLRQLGLRRTANVAHE